MVHHPKDDIWSSCANSSGCGEHLLWGRGWGTWTCPNKGQPMANTHITISTIHFHKKKHNCWVSSVQAASLYLIREIDLWKWNNVSIHSRDGGGPCALNSPTQLPDVLLKHHIYYNLTLTRYGSAISKLGEGAGIVFSIDFVQKPQEGCMYFMQQTRLWPAAGPTKHYSAGHPHNKE